MLKNYFKTAFRSLVHNKNYTIINISGLAVGVAVCIMIFIIIQFQFINCLIDSYFRAKSRLSVNRWWIIPCTGLGSLSWLKPSLWQLARVPMRFMSTTWHRTMRESDQSLSNTRRDTSCASQTISWSHGPTSTTCSTSASWTRPSCGAGLCKFVCHLYCSNLIIVQFNPYFCWFFYIRVGTWFNVSWLIRGRRAGSEF